MNTKQSLGLILGSSWFGPPFLRLAYSLICAFGVRKGEVSGPLVALNHIKVGLQSQAVSGQSCTKWVLTFLLGGFLEFCAPGTA